MGGGGRKEWGNRNEQRWGEWRERTLREISGIGGHLRTS